MHVVRSVVIVYIGKDLEGFRVSGGVEFDVLSDRFQHCATASLDGLGKRLERVVGLLAMSVAEPLRAPGLGVPAVAAATRLGVIEVHLVAVVGREREARVAQHTGLVTLAGLADPNDIVLSELILTHLPRASEAKVFQHRSRCFASELFRPIPSEERVQSLVKDRRR
jgi:hypothetical protein